MTQQIFKIDLRNGGAKALIAGQKVLLYLHEKKIPYTINRSHQHEEHIIYESDIPFDPNQPKDQSMNALATPSLVQRITDALNHFINQFGMFTMLDISNKVKSDGHGFVGHSEVRKDGRAIADGMIVGRGYTSTEITVQTPTGPARALLYHPDNTDPAAYQNRAQVALSLGQQAAPVGSPSIAATPALAAPTTSAAAPKATKSTSSALDNESVISKRNDGKLEIPIKIIDAAALRDELVMITYHPNSITIEESAAGDRRAIGGFRLSAANLERAGLAIASTVKAKAFSKKIVLSKG